MIAIFDPPAQRVVAKPMFSEDVIAGSRLSKRDTITFPTLPRPRGDDMFSLRYICCVLSFALALSLSGTAGAVGTESVLYSFKGGTGDGASPVAPLTMGGGGALYGATYNGGLNENGGVLFRLAPPAAATVKWVETKLASLEENPQTGLTIASDGTFIAVSEGQGGSTSFEGILYQFEPARNGFGGGPVNQFLSTAKGRLPIGAPVADASGNMYGATLIGGAYQEGVVYKFRPNPTRTSIEITPIFNFGVKNKLAGKASAGLTIDAAGSLYGVVNSGAYGHGGVFKLTPPAKGAAANAQWMPSLIYSFKGGVDGGEPKGELVIDTDGRIYGTTYGGTGVGRGSVFRLTPPAAGRMAWTETVLHRFAAGLGGDYPMGALLKLANGAIYGTTLAGGSANLGTVYRLLPPASGQGLWNWTLLHSFAGNGDGAKPKSGLITDSHGNLFGTTYSGGADNLGTVFEVTP